VFIRSGPSGLRLFYGIRVFNGAWVFYGVEGDNAMGFEVGKSSPCKRLALGYGFGKVPFVGMVFLCSSTL